ncbi:unknown [Cryptobacterium sp. CAG:338]|nr:unknown [Cryptobacterium sp. CAG:338]
MRERELAVVDQILEGSFPSRLLTIDRSAEVEIARVFVTEDAREILATRLADDGKRHLGSEHLVDGVFIGILAISVARVIVGVDNAPVDSLGIA